MAIERIVDLTARAASFADALSLILGQLVLVIADEPDDHRDPDRSTRISAEADDEVGLVAAMIDQVCLVGSDFDARPVTVTVEGHRRLSEGVRTWGVVGLSLGDDLALATVRRAGLPVVRQEPDWYSIQAQIAIN